MLAVFEDVLAKMQTLSYTSLTVLTGIFKEIPPKNTNAEPFPAKKLLVGGWLIEGRESLLRRSWNLTRVGKERDVISFSSSSVQPFALSKFSMRFCVHVDFLILSRLLIMARSQYKSKKHSLVFPVSKRRVGVCVADVHETRFFGGEGEFVNFKMQMNMHQEAICFRTSMLVSKKQCALRCPIPKKQIFWRLFVSFPVFSGGQFR